MAQADDLSTYNAAIDSALKRQQDAATRARGAADTFQGNLPTYVGNQVNAASDSAKNQLASDLQKTRASDNSRGMLYSGVRESDEGGTRAQASTQLAGQIQGINQKAQAQGDQLNQQASQAENEVAKSQISNAQFQAQQQQNTYQQALQQQQNQNSFFGSLFGGIAGVAGKVFGLG